MMRRHPGLLALIPLKHGKVRYPQEPVILRRIARLLEDPMPLGILLRQCQTQQPRRSVDRQLLRSHFAMAMLGTRRLRPALPRTNR